jgi:hypothetical protein
MCPAYRRAHVLPTTKVSTTSLLKNRAQSNQALAAPLPSKTVAFKRELRKTG